jgi:BirA family transcriptional regulator, biotin operon repressor / biotin---[acetyl-CoA-carboxylase] ligase
MPLFDLPRLKSAPHLAALEHHEQIGSTSDRALELARQEELALPLLILADQQSGGRGRGSNQWWAAAGSLTFSLLIDSGQFGIASSKWPVLSLSTGLAICEALEQIAPGGDFGVKWPNDVYCSGRKICGILIESPSASRGRVIVGIGLNVNNSLTAAPSEIQALATSLVDYLRRPLDMTGVLLNLLASLQSRWQELGSSGSEPQVAEFRRRCILDGRTVQVSSGSRLITGRCLGIDDSGSLVLQTESGREAIASGSVVSIQ